MVAPELRSVLVGLIKINDVDGFAIIVIDVKNGGLRHLHRANS